MKSVDTGKDKVKKICEVLRKETIDPAKKEAESIVADARAEASRIVEEARLSAKRSLEKAKQEIEEDRNVFDASLELACKKSLGALKQEIETALFNPALSELVKKGSEKADVVEKMISALVSAIEKEGIESDLRAEVPKAVSTDEVNKKLAESILKRVEGGSVQLGEFAGGAKVKIISENLTVDMSDEAIKGLLARFIREDFRSIIFSA